MKINSLYLQIQSFKIIETFKFFKSFKQFLHFEAFFNMYDFLRLIYDLHRCLLRFDTPPPGGFDSLSNYIFLPITILGSSIPLYCYGRVRKISFIVLHYTLCGNLFYVVQLFFSRYSASRGSECWTRRCAP